MRTSVEVVRSAYATALEGFALPYGDVTVGGWRNTPYVVIQNVGAYLDIPRFLDSDHPIENAADAEAYLARLQSYAKQLDGELGRMQAARARRSGAAGVPDRQGAGANAAVARRARAKAARSSNRSSGGRRAFPGDWAERARTIAAQEIAPALERQIAELQAQRAVATDDAGMWARPHGEEFYRWALKASTTTNMSPDEVHEMGQSELERLHAEMDAILKDDRLLAGHRRRTDEGARRRIRATSSPEATRAAPRSWRSSRIASTGSGRRCRARSTRSSIRTWK